MNEDALRALVRDVIARMDSSREQPVVSDAPQLIHLSHPSGYQYQLPPTDGPCLIEPAVRCNHCGYCQTHGH